MFNQLKGGAPTRWGQALLLLVLLLVSELGAAHAQAPAPPDTAALSARYYNPARPDTARLRAGLQLVQVLGSDTLALRRRWALATRLLAQAQRLRYPALESLALTELQLLAGQTNRPAEQLRYTRQQLALAQQQHDTTTLVHANYELANSYFDAENMPEARRYAERADHLLRRHPVPAKVEAALLSRLTNIYLELKQSALARQVFRRALPAVRRTGQPLYEFNLLATYANGLRLAQPDSALPYLHRALALAQAMHNPYALAYAHMLLMQTYKPLANWPGVRAEARLALRYARLSGTPDYEAEALAGLAESLRHFGQGTAAYDTLRLAQTLLDTLQAAANKQELNALQVAAGTARQQARIQALEQDRRLRRQQLQLERLLARQRLLGAAGLAALLLVLAGGLFWQYRRRQAVQRVQAAAALRQRLAADLHDDVGNLLTQVSVQSDVLRELVPAAAPLHARLDALADTARHAAQQMTDVVLNLHAEVRTLPQLLARLHDHAYQMLPSSGLDVEFQTPAALPATPLPAEVLHHLYLIYKEALHNVVKHAQATGVTVSLTTTPTTVALTVADNGRGHDGTPRPGGQGLRNMQARAQAVGGTVRYAGTAGGFAVVAELPR